MEVQGFGQQSSAMNDKVGVGYITTQTLMKMMEASACGEWSSYVNLMSFLDNFLVQYKDDQYDKEMERAGFLVKLKDPKTGKFMQKQGGGYIYVKSQNHLDKPEEAHTVLRILMKLMQRSNFMPIRVYEGDLYVDVSVEKDMEGEDSEEENNGTVV